MSDSTRQPNHPQQGPPQGQGPPALSAETSRETGDGISPAGPSAKTRPRSPGEALSGEEIRRALVRPDLMFEYVLASRDRMRATLTTARGIWWLAAMLLAVSLASTVPYGAVSPIHSFWKVAVLFVGSVLICLPCLHVFSQFLGMRIDLGKSLALALVITSVAGLFTFGFAPIIWFIDCTTEAGPDAAVTPRGLSVFLLCFSLLMGIGRMATCLPVRCAKDAPWLPLLMIHWVALIAFITYRMARLLELIQW